MNFGALTPRRSEGAWVAHTSGKVEKSKIFLSSIELYFAIVIEVGAVVARRRDFCARLFMKNHVNFDRKVISN